MTEQASAARLTALLQRDGVYDGDVEAAVTALCAHVETLQQENARLEAEVTRALLRGTAKGYAAGESTDGRHWRKRAEEAEAQLSQVRNEGWQKGYSDSEATYALLRTKFQQAEQQRDAALVALKALQTARLTSEYPSAAAKMLAMGHILDAALKGAVR